MKRCSFNKTFGLSVMVGVLFIITMVLAPQPGIAAGPFQQRGNGPTSLQEFLQQQENLKQSGREGTLKSAPKHGSGAFAAPDGKKQLESCTAVLDDNYVLNVPIVDIENDYYWLEMAYQGNGYFLFTGFDFQNPGGFTGCDHAYLTTPSTVYVPLMYFGGYFFWLELTYVGCDSSGCWFGLTKFGPVYY
ncbi:MAG: hypothetical protein HQK59_10435 [Deltaproteobacteria bacterium]|nr:hypothetical protein [Deltaproteobacteria bacterium]